MRATSDAVLSLERVTVRREGRAVLEDVSLEVEATKIHAIVGPNGGGKSTLVAAVLGQVEFEGAITRRLVRTRRIGFVPQSFAADRTLPITVAELLALTRQQRPVCFGVGAEAKKRIAIALERVGLSGFETRRLGELSGGELRRVLVANAIEPIPDLLILDEPATGMDEPSQDRLDAVIVEAAREGGAAILMVSHDRARVRKTADRVTVIDGKVKASGAPAEVLDGPRSGSGGSSIDE